VPWKRVILVVSYIQSTLVIICDGQSQQTRQSWVRARYEAKEVREVVVENVGGSRSSDSM